MFVFTHIYCCEDGTAKKKIWGAFLLQKKRVKFSQREKREIVFVSELWLRCQKETREP